MGVSFKAVDNAVDVDVLLLASSLADTTNAEDVVKDCVIVSFWPDCEISVFVGWAASFAFWAALPDEAMDSCCGSWDELPELLAGSDEGRSTCG